MKYFILLSLLLSFSSFAQRIHKCGEGDGCSVEDVLRSTAGDIGESLNEMGNGPNANECPSHQCRSGFNNRLWDLCTGGPNICINPAQRFSNQRDNYGFAPRCSPEVKSQCPAIRRECEGAIRDSVDPRSDTMFQ